MVHQNLYHDNRSLMYHDNRNIAVFKFGRPHMVRPVLRSENWNFPLNREGRVSVRSVGYSKAIPRWRPVRAMRRI